jgi:hypothetical protein
MVRALNGDLLVWHFLLKAAPPELPALTAAAPRSTPRIPAVLLLRVHLLHVYAQDKYHGCIRNDMMLMMNG